MPDLKTQIADLREIGIHLKSDISVDDLLDFHSQYAYEDEPYLRLLRTMGEYAELSDQFFYLDDTEMIEDNNSYTSLARRLIELTEGDLVVENLHSHVDHDAQIAWIAFSLSGKDYYWKLKYNNDWLDRDIIGKFAQLLKEQPTSKRYIRHDTEILIGCVTEVQLDALVQRFNLKFKLVHW